MDVLTCGFIHVAHIRMDVSVCIFMAYIYYYGHFYQCTTSALGSCWLDAKLLVMSGVFVILRSSMDCPPGRIQRAMADMGMPYMVVRLKDP